MLSTTLRLLCGLSLLASSFSDTVDTFTFHCAPSCTVYVDGVGMGTSINVDTGLVVPVNAGAQVIAVDINRKSNPTGFVGSSTHGVITDNTWKCVRTYEPDYAWVINSNWQDPSFDDSTWPTGHLYQYDDVREHPWWAAYSDINNVAMWIGVGYSYDPWNNNVHVLCRKRLAHRITLDCDDSCSLWVDGNPFASAGFDSPYSYDLPANAKVLAVDVDNTINQPGGLLLSSNKGLYSDNSWKCTSNTPPSGWQALNFDDSSWPQANWMYNDGKSRSYIDDKAKWIGSGCASSSSHFYCRKRL